MIGRFGGRRGMWWGWWGWGRGVVPLFDLWGVLVGVWVCSGMISSKKGLSPSFKFSGTVLSLAKGPLPLRFPFPLSSDWCTH